MKITANVLEIRAPNKFTPAKAVQAQVPALFGRGRRLLIAGVGEAVRMPKSCSHERQPRGAATKNHRDHRSQPTTTQFALPHGGWCRSTVPRRSRMMHSRQPRAKFKMSIPMALRRCTSAMTQTALSALTPLLRHASMCTANQSAMLCVRGVHSESERDALRAE